MTDRDSLLLVTHVHLRAGPNGLQIDDQTAAGIAQWCRHFESVTFYGLLLGAGQSGPASTVWVDLDPATGGRATLIGLPFAYGPPRMARHYRRVRAELARAVAAHRHLCFTLGNIIGDWPAVAAWEAIRQHRRYAAWIDRVEPAIIRTELAGSGLKRFAAEATIPLTQAAVRHLLRRSAVALLQGGDTFAHYARAAPDPHVTYDVHLGAEERIAPSALAAKKARVVSGAPLEIVYVGRAAAMKGPFDWIETLAGLRGQGVPFRARWIGDGPDLPAIRERVAALDLADAIGLPGFERRREVLLAALRDGDLLLFCHKTPESARCLVEALVCGCPIVGYESAYPAGLVAGAGGGAFVAQNDVPALTATLAALHRDRARLAGLIGDAARSGERFNEDAIYAHRAALMKRA